MALPGAENLCLTLTTTQDEVCIVLPGGAFLCVQGDIEWDDIGAIAKNALGQINTALTPLTPFFTVFDVLIAIFECIKAVKAAFGPPPDPSQLVKCITNLQEVIDKLINLHPALSIPKTIRGILDVMILFMLGIRSEIVQLLAFAQGIADAATRSAVLGNIELDIAIGCAQDQFDIELTNLNASVSPLSRLVGVLNLFMTLAGLDCIQIPLGPIEALTDSVLEDIDAAIEFLTTVRDAIPSIELILDALPAPGDPC